MSEKVKIEELEQKCAELSRSKNKAKVAYFKVKKDQENDKIEKDKLMNEVASLREEIKKLNEAISAKDESMITLVKEVETKEKTTTDGSKVEAKMLEEIESLKKRVVELEKERSESGTLQSKLREEIESLQLKVAESQKDVEQKNSTLLEKIETIKLLETKINEAFFLKMDSDQQNEGEQTNKRRKTEGASFKELALKEREKRLLEFRVKDLIRKREMCNQAYSLLEREIEAQNSKLEEFHILKFNLENEIAKLDQLSNEKQISLDKVQTVMVSLGTLLKTLKKDVDGLTNMQSSIEQLHNELQVHSSPPSPSPSIPEEITVGSGDAVKTSLGDSSSSLRLSSSLSKSTAEMNMESSNVKSSVSGLLASLKQLCDTELEHRMVLKTRTNYPILPFTLLLLLLSFSSLFPLLLLSLSSHTRLIFRRYLDAKFADIEYEMAAISNQ